MVDTILTSFKYKKISLDCELLMSFDDNSWDEGKEGFFSPIPLNSVTRYYRLSFTLPSTLPSFAGIRFIFNLKYGIVVYIDGTEMDRYNMPE